MGGRLRRAMRSSCRGVYISRFWMANAAVIGLFVIYRTLVGAAYRTVTDNIFKGVFHL